MLVLLETAMRPRVDIIYYIPFSIAIIKSQISCVFSANKLFIGKKKEKMLLRFELTSSVLRAMRLVHCTTAADRDDKQLHS